MTCSPDDPDLCSGPESLRGSLDSGRFRVGLTFESGRKYSRSDVSELMGLGRNVYCRTRLRI